ncbi:MAG: hypothetical protein Q8O41_10490, partial [Candidatus Methanoperedens sp.]|nr:hypothetical protein [Candidatus Methanoperedens sp.]
MVTEISENNFFGQTKTHLLHARHLTLSTTGKASVDIVIAPKGHAFTQVPKPKQAKTQHFCPPKTKFAAIQSLTP